MLSSNEDYLSIINNLIEEQNYDDAGYEGAGPFPDDIIRKFRLRKMEVLDHHIGSYDDKDAVDEKEEGRAAEEAPVSVRKAISRCT